MAPKDRLPAERPGRVHRVIIGDQKIYIRTGEYEDGSLGEIFITIDKEGCKLRVYDALAISISIGLQNGVPLSDYIDKLQYLRYDPQGLTNNPDIPIVSSIADYLAKWLDRTYNKSN
jgi:ribonucleoside-diphosphate reductase alpha chain